MQRIRESFNTTWIIKKSKKLENLDYISLNMGEKNKKDKMGGADRNRIYDDGLCLELHQKF